MSRIFRGPSPVDDFTMIPNSVTRSGSLSMRAKTVYIFMASHSDGWNITTRSVGHALGMNKDIVASAIKDLIESGHMRRIERRDENGKFAGWDYETLSNPTTASEKTGSGKTGHIRRLYSKKTKEITSLSQEDHAQTSGSSECDQPSPSTGFDEFWDAYPRKVGKKKHAPNSRPPSKQRGCSTHHRRGRASRLRSELARQAVHPASDDVAGAGRLG